MKNLLLISTILASTVFGQNQGSNAGQLSALDTAYKAGVLTREEYEAKKRELTRGTSAPAATRTPAPAAAPVSAAGWSAHRDPQGFELRTPPGWTVNMDTDHRIRATSANGDSTALIVPFVRAGASCRDSLGQTLSRMVQGFEPGAFTQKRQTPDEAVGTFTYGGGRFRGSALCSIYRGSGMIFAIAAPSRDFDRQKPELVKVVSSFTVTQAAGSGAGPAAAQARPQLRYVRWDDPAEHSFSLEVPEGWRIQGGLRRRNGVDMSAGVRAYSPDGQVVAFINDDELLASCIGPESFTGYGAMNYHEGQIYSPGYGTQMMMLRYQPGAVFAANYIGMRLARLLNVPGIQIVDRKDRRDLTDLAARNGSRANVGEASFTAANGQVAGYVLAATTPIAAGMWSPAVLGYSAPTNRVAEAMEVLSRMMQTSRPNAQWVAGQQQTTAAVSGIVSRTASEISEVFSQSYWNTQNRYATVFQSGSDARRGQVRLQDPTTGETFVTAGGKNYYWRPIGADERGIIGTDNTDRPNIDVTQLLIMP